MEQLSELIEWGLRGGPDDLVVDADVKLVQAVKIKVRRSKGRVKAGDLIGVPAGDGLFHIGVFITRNSIGSAFGFFKGTQPLRGFAVDDLGDPLGHVYTGEELIKAGEWPILGRDEKLLASFSSNPESYHDKRHHQDNESIGEFGAAYTGSRDSLRQLGRSEAERVGLLDSTYDTTVFSDELWEILASGRFLSGPWPGE